MRQVWPCSGKWQVIESTGKGLKVPFLRRQEIFPVWLSFHSVPRSFVESSVKCSYDEMKALWLTPYLFSPQVSRQATLSPRRMSIQVAYRIQDLSYALLRFVSPRGSLPQSLAVDHQMLRAGYEHFASAVLSLTHSSMLILESLDPWPWYIDTSGQEPVRNSHCILHQMEILAIEKRPQMVIARKVPQEQELLLRLI